MILCWLFLGDENVAKELMKQCVQGGISTLYIYVPTLDMVNFIICFKNANNQILKIC